VTDTKSTQHIAPILELLWPILSLAIEEKYHTNARNAIEAHLAQSFSAGVVHGIDLSQAVLQKDESSCQ
jgi:hypothetical protein